jgi:hypothetical protein
MADAKLEFIGGVDLRPYRIAASEIKNLRYDDGRLCWLNDRSYTDYLNPDDATPEPTYTGFPTVSIYSHQFHRTGKHALFYESQGAVTCTLNCIQGPTNYTVDSLRPIPEANDPGTQFIPIGRFLFVIRGGHSPLVVNDLGQSRVAFFHSVPTPPDPIPAWGVHKGNIGDQSIGTLNHVVRVGAGGLVILDARGNLGMAPSPERETIDTNNQIQNISLNTHNSYQYAVSYISDTGAESPISPLSAQVAWSYQAGLAENDTRKEYKHGIALQGIPIGPEGTVKRRLYRTKNQLSGGAHELHGSQAGGDQTLFFLTDVADNVTTNYLDLIPDSGLGSQSPPAFASRVFPSTATVAAAFKNRLLLSGISEEKTVVYYSRAGFPEQLPSLNYLDLGADGGGITGLHSTDNLCYVFRENGIDLLVPTENLDLPFKQVPLTRSVGSLSPNSVVDVPGVGVIFLGSDRVFYAVSKQGNFDGGAALVPLGEPIEPETRKINKNALARVYAVYSPRDKEYWATCPMNGGRYATQGFCFHVPVQAWSFRKNIPAGCFTYIPEGWVAFGGNGSQSNLPVISGVDEGEFNDGLFVWCGAKGQGYTNDGAQQPVRQATTGCAPYTYETTWMSLGEPNALKSIRGLTLYCYKNVSGGGDMRVGVDWKPLVYEGAEEELDTNFDTYNSERPPAAVYGTGKFDGGFKSTTVRAIDDNRWSADEIMQVRLSNPYVGYEVQAENGNITAAPSVNSATQMGSGGARWFKFRFSGSDPIDLIGFTVHYELNGDIKQLSFGAGKNDTRDTLLRSILGMS